MCGRYTLNFTIQEALDAFNIKKALAEFSRSFNVAPTQDVPVIYFNNTFDSTDINDYNKSELVLDVNRWGLIPHWAQDEKIGLRLINARAETVAEKNSFKYSFEHNRCLILASGFYEWQKIRDLKVPHYITIKDQPIIAFAGLSSKWTSPDGKVIKSCTIITTQANRFMSYIHDRMPVILAPELVQTWLSKDAKKEDLLNLLKPVHYKGLREIIVSDQVNSPQHNGPELIEKVNKWF